MLKTKTKNKLKYKINKSGCWLWGLLCKIKKKVQSESENWQTKENGSSTDNVRRTWSLPGKTKTALKDVEAVSMLFECWCKAPLGTPISFTHCQAKTKVALGVANNQNKSDLHKYKRIARQNKSCLENAKRWVLQIEAITNKTKVVFKQILL